MQVLFADVLSPAETQAIAALLYRVWPNSTRSLEERLARVPTEWSGYDGPELQRPRYFVVHDVPPSSDGSDLGDAAAIAAMALAAPRTIRAGDSELTILAMARVCSAPEHRGRGLAAQAVRAAFQLVDEGVYPFALFQTTPPVRTFYEKLGARVIGNRIVNSRAEDPTACPFWTEVIMRYPDGPGWPEGTIDLLGPGY
jgi:GNAT superfamily N-acetyltransferase